MAVSGLITAGVFAGLDGVHSLAGWQWLLILEGALGCLFAVIALFVLPDYPDSKTGSTRWSMTEDLRHLAAARMEADGASEPQSTLLLTAPPYVLGAIASLFGHVNTLQDAGEARSSAAIVNVFGHCDSIMSPYFFPSSDAPRYLILIMMGMAVLTTTMALATKFVLVSEKKKLRVESEEREVTYNPYTL